MTTEALDLPALLAETSEGGLPDDATLIGNLEIGHIQLQVTDLSRSEEFYCGLLGFDVTQRTFPGALFVSAGGYQHHIGLDIWNTRHGLPADDERLGMMSFSIRLGDGDALARVRRQVGASGLSSVRLRDPDQIAIELIG